MTAQPVPGSPSLDEILASARCFSGTTVAGWTLDLSLTLPLLLAAAIYAAGVARLWRRAGAGHGAQPWQVAAFALGWLGLAGALVSPLHQLSRSLLSVHMVEHELMMAVAAPLLMLGRPAGPMLWSLPQSWRRRLGAVPRNKLLSAVWRFISDPAIATLLHGLAIWIWHVPAPFEAALNREWVHWLQHASFLVTGLLFWWALLQGRARERGYGAGAFYLFGTALHTTLLGALLVLSPRLWYPPAAAAVGRALTPIEDQQLAGLIMWVPAGLIYAVAALALAGLWIGRSSRPAGDPHGLGAR